MLSSVSCLVLLQGIFPLWRSISRHISATKWHGSLYCYIWNYEHPASKKPCPIFAYGDVGVFMKIYETVKKLRYLISYFKILLYYRYFMLSDFGVAHIFDGKSTLLPMDGGPNQTNQSPVRSPVSNSRAYGRWLWGSFAWLRAAACSIFSPFPIFGIASCGI